MEFDELEKLMELYELANNAKLYARQQIIKGSTQLENNSLLISYWNALEKGVSQVRNLHDEILKEKPQLDAHKIISDYEGRISISSKYSLGNCHELVFHAFDYILNNYKDMYAEIYGIYGGDHVFLVLNRDRNSDPSNPMTWGKLTIICDPWADIVYKASEYQSKLKNFYRKNNKNHTEDFNHWKHTLKPLPHLNTDFFKKYRNIKALHTNFKKICNGLLQKLKKIKQELGEESELLSKKIEQCILDINDKIKNVEIESDNYRVVKKQLAHVLDEISIICKKVRKIKESQNINNCLIM